MRQTARPSSPRCEAAISNDRKALTGFGGGWGNGRRRFVLRFFIGARGLRLLDRGHCGRGWFGGRWRKPRADAWVILQFAERAVGAFVDAVQTGFVTRGERNGA